MTDPPSRPASSSGTGSPLLLDACVVLSLYATGEFERILAAAVPVAVICENVVREALFVHRTVDGVRERAPIDLEPAIAGGLLSVVDFASEDEAETFVSLATVLDDGEAASAAIAILRGWRLATDDRKAIEVVAGRATIVGTLDLVRDWASISPIDDDALRIMLGRIRDRGYVPARTHPHRTWWDRLVG